jgi:hypothetical protein
MIRVLLAGDFWNRQPLAYTPIRNRLEGRIELVDDPSEAQLVLFSHSHDLANHGKAFSYMLAAHPRLQLVLLSEEPFWDTCWAADPFSKYQTWTAGPAPFAYSVLNHATSDIYDTSAIPYFLLTDPRYIARLKPLIERNAGFAAADWLARWRKVTWDAAFMAERRDASRHSPGFPAKEVWGLSGLRGRITRDCKGGNILRSGRGWDTDIRRTEEPNWHADKLARLDLKCRYVSALENTHQANYVTEKIYDAFAVGGVPLYIALKSHAVFRHVGAEAWVNLQAHLPRKSAEPAPPFDAGAAISADLAKAYAATQTRLAQLFSDPSHVETELDRLTDRLFDALRRLAPATGSGRAPVGKRP